HVVQVERVLEVGRETAQAERRSASVPRCHLAQDLPDKPLRIFPVALRRGGQYGVLLMEDLAAHIRAKIAAGTPPSLPTALGSCGSATATDGSATPATRRSPPPIESTRSTLAAIGRFGFTRSASPPGTTRTRRGWRTPMATDGYGKQTAR